MWNSVKKVLLGIKEKWYQLHPILRHAGGSAVLVMVFAGFQQMLGMQISWALAAGCSLIVGIIKEAVEEDNQWLDTTNDLVWNILGISVTLLFLFALGNKITP